MKSLRLNLRKTTHGGALPFALMVLLIITLMMSSSLQSSLNWNNVVRMNLRSSSIEIKLKDHYANIQQALADQVSLWMSVKNTCAKMGLIAQDCYNQRNSLFGSLLTQSQLSANYVLLAAQGNLPAEAISKSYQPIVGENFRWTQSCIENCTTDSNSYPKRFMVSVSAIEGTDNSTELTVSGINEITRKSLSEYSILALGISGSANWNIETDTWPSFPMATVGPGTHGAVGIFFDTPSLQAFELATNGQAPEGGVGTIHFFTGSQETVAIKHLSTNTKAENIFLNSTGGLSQNASRVVVQAGISASVSPADEVQLSLRSTAESDPSTIRQQDSDTASNDDRCNATDSRIWARPILAELKMWCSSNSECSMQLREWRKKQENSAELKECRTKTFNGSQENLHKKIIYTSARRVNVVGSGTNVSFDNADIDDSNFSSAYGSHGVPQFGNSNLTIIAAGSFYPIKSFERKGPRPIADRAGNLALVSLEDHAIRITENFTTKIQDKTLKNLAQDGMPTNSTTALSVHIPVGAITTAFDKAPIFVDRHLLSDQTRKHLGTFRSDGPLWGFQLSALRMVHKTPQSTSLIKTGFSKVETSFPASWTQYSAPGLDIQTSGDHRCASVSTTVERTTLKNIMAERNVAWIQ